MKFSTRNFVANNLHDQCARYRNILICDSAIDIILFNIILFKQHYTH